MQLLRSLQSALTNHERPWRRVGDQALAGMQRNVERVEVTIVYTDLLCACS